MKGTLEENRLIQRANTLADLVILSLLWIACSLPIVTIGLANAALYHAIELSVLHKRKSAAGVFLHAIRENWRRALLFGVLFTAGGAALGFAVYLCMTDPSGVLLVPLLACCVLSALWMAFQIYLYPLMAHFYLTVRQLLEMTLQLVFLHPLKSAILLAIWLSGAALILWYPPLGMILPSVCMLLSSKVCTPLFFRYIRVEAEE